MQWQAGSKARLQLSVVKIHVHVSVGSTCAQRTVLPLERLLQLPLHEGGSGLRCFWCFAPSATGPPCQHVCSGFAVWCQAKWRELGDKTEDVGGLWPLSKCIPPSGTKPLPTTSFWCHFGVCCGIVVALATSLLPLQQPQSKKATSCHQRSTRDLVQKSVQQYLPRHCTTFFTLVSMFCGRIFSCTGTVSSFSGLQVSVNKPSTASG
jgi:hypothetical protein